jgi:hypothetical protein
MTHPLETRVSRLEKIRDEPNSSWADPWTRAVRADGDGTATLEQYELVYADQLVGWREDLLARVPALVAREKAGVWAYDMYHCLAYPPDQPLPEDDDSWLLSIAYDASISVDEMKKNAKTNEAPLLVTTPRQRASWAGLLLMLGGRHALGMRSRAWTATDGRWHMSEEAMTLARSTCAPLSEASKFLAFNKGLAPRILDGTLRTFDGTIPEHPASALVSWAELAEAFDRFNITDRWQKTWSDQVRSGHQG